MGDPRHRLKDDHVNFAFGACMCDLPGYHCFLEVTPSMEIWWFYCDDCRSKWVFQAGTSLRFTEQEVAMKPKRRDYENNIILSTENMRRLTEYAEIDVKLPPWVQQG